ncbi:MAG TPA: hypothetical protein VES39_03985 [Rhodospirillales bacterium]|nr:hypothetical protein [Rhodospirillales bacterium]
MTKTGMTGIAVAACLTGAFIGGCSGESKSTPPATTAPAAGSLEGRGFVAEELVRGTATVKSVNAAKRSVTLANADGKTLVVKVSDNVDLAKVKAGDTVDIAFFESVAIDVAKPGTAVPGVTRGIAVAPAQAGQVPSGAVLEQTTATAEVTAIDMAAHTVTLRGPDGELKTITVKNPELQQKMAGLRVGDLVQFTYTEALAVQVEPRAR